MFQESGLPGRETRLRFPGVMGRWHHKVPDLFFFLEKDLPCIMWIDKPSSWIWAIISLPETELVTPPEERHCFEALQTAAITDDSSVAIGTSIPSRPESGWSLLQMECPSPRSRFQPFRLRSLPEGSRTSSGIGFHPDRVRSLMRFDPNVLRWSVDENL